MPFVVVSEIPKETKIHVKEVDDGFIVKNLSTGVEFHVEDIFDEYFQTAVYGRPQKERQGYRDGDSER